MLAMAATVACQQDQPVDEAKLEVSTETVALEATAAEATFEVTSNQNWTATADADWVTLDPASGEGAAEAVVVKVTAEDNEATEARTATVTVTAGELTKTVALTQAGTEVEPLPTPNADWTSEAVVSYDLPESASSKRQLLKNIKYLYDENYLYLKVQASLAAFEAAPAEYFGMFVYDVTDGSGDGYYGWWNDAKGNNEFEGEHIGTFNGTDLTLTVGETPVEVIKEVNGDELVWTLNILRSAHENLALENPHFAVLTYIGWEPNGALPDKYENMLQFTPATVEPEPEPEPEVPAVSTIASVLALGQNATIPADTFVEGIVISNMDLNNLTSKKGMYIQDETAGLQFYLAANHTFKYGDKVKVNLSGAQVGAYNGAVQISGLALEKIEVLSSGNTVEAKTVTIADFLANKYEGQYVAIENVQVADSDLSKTWGDPAGSSHKSINIEDANGNKFVVFSSKYASYKSETVAQGSGTIKGISSINNGNMQLIFTQTSDFAGLTGTRFGQEVVEPETPETPAVVNRDDFATIAKASSAYATTTTTAGWVLTNCAVQQGKAAAPDANPAYVVIGYVDGTEELNKAACMNGKISAPGTIESPELTGGCGVLSFDYSKMFTDPNTSFKVEIIQGENVVKEFTVTETINKLEKYSHSEEINIAGTFKIKFTNLSPSALDSNKDRVTIWNITWTSVE